MPSSEPVPRSQYNTAFLFLYLVPFYPSNFLNLYLRERILIGSWVSYLMMVDYARSLCSCKWFTDSWELTFEVIEVTSISLFIWEALGGPKDSWGVHSWPMQKTSIGVGDEAGTINGRILAADIGILFMELLVLGAALVREIGLRVNVSVEMCLGV